MTQYFTQIDNRSSRKMCNKTAAQPIFKTLGFTLRLRMDATWHNAYTKCRKTTIIGNRYVHPSDFISPQGNSVLKSIKQTHKKSSLPFEKYYTTYREI